MDRLEVELAREHEILVLQLRIAVERRLQRDPDRVLDETGLEMRMLHDEELVRPLEQLVDRRAHRTLDDAGELFRVHCPLAADVERSAATLVVSRKRDELEEPVDVGL